MGHVRTTAALIGIAIIAICAATGPTYAADEPTSALRLTNSDGLELVARDGDGIVRVTLANNSTKKLEPAFSLLREGSAGDCSEVFKPTADTEGGIVPPLGTNTFDVAFVVPAECIGATATLLVTADPGVALVSGKVSIVREIEMSDYAAPLLASVIFGLAFLLSSLVLLRRRLAFRTASGDSWSFSGSWLTSISGIGTALAGVLAASGFITEVLPGVPLGHFLGLSLTFGLLILAAPLAFSIFQVTEWEKVENHKPDEPDRVQVVNGRVIGVAVAGALTCAGVGGQLAMLTVLTNMSVTDNLARGAVLFLLGCGFVFLAIYVTTSTVQASALSRPRSDREIEAPANNLATYSQQLSPSASTGAM